MNAMNYKNFTVTIEFDAQDRIFVGQVVGVNDVIGFHGATVDELEQDFHAAIDEYLTVLEREASEV